MCVPAHEAFMYMRCDNGVGVAHQTVSDAAEVGDDPDERVDVAPKEDAVLERTDLPDLPAGVHVKRPLIVHIREMHGLSMSLSPRAAGGCT